MRAPQRALLAPFVEAVLLKARKGKGGRRQYLTSYQILARLPKAQRSQLIASLGARGKHAGKAATGPRAIADIVKHNLKGKVQVEYMDAVGTAYDIGRTRVYAGYGVVGLYRLL